MVWIHAVYVSASVCYAASRIHAVLARALNKSTRWHSGNQKQQSDTLLRPSTQRNTGSVKLEGAVASNELTTPEAPHVICTKI